MKWTVLFLGVLLLLFGCLSGGGEETSKSEEIKRAVLYKSPYCGCCTGYADYLRQNGYEVEEKVVQDMDNIKKVYGIPQDQMSCHTTVLEGYVIEGHVPVEFIERLLEERPDVEGIALAGMPPGSPGMGGVKQGPFQVYSIKNGKSEFYASG